MDRFNWPCLGGNPHARAGGYFHKHVACGEPMKEQGKNVRRKEPERGTAVN